MTDRVGLVRAEIKRLRKDVKDYIAELGNFESEKIGLFKDLEIYDNILSFIDSMQEEPKAKFKVGDVIRSIDISLGSPRIIKEVCDSWYVTDKGTLDFEYEDNWELVEEPSIQDIVDEHWWEMLGEEPICAYRTNRYTDEDRKVLCDGCEEDCEYKKKEELVSKVWHDASEEPEEDEEILYQWETHDHLWHDIGFYHKDTKIFVTHTNVTSVEEVSKWIYVKDIINYIRL